MTRFVVVIPLVLVGMLAIFAAQPAQADRIGSAKGSVRGSMTGATNDYTFSVMTNMVTIGDATFTPDVHPNAHDGHGGRVQRVGHRPAGRPG